MITTVLAPFTLAMSHMEFAMGPAPKMTTISFGVMLALLIA